MAPKSPTIPNDFGKPSRGFKDLGTSLEPNSLELGVDETPVGRFFVCSGCPAPNIDPETWRISIDGAAVSTAIELSIADLHALPQHTVHSWLECAGNGRAMYALAGGYEEARELADTGWTLGGMGIASWTGPRLRDVLALAGIEDSAAWVGPEGADDDHAEGEAARMSLPLDKALHDDTLVALTMNGEPLVRAHGAPARMLVPGWIGAYSVKWLRRIEVAPAWIPSWRADVYYVHRKPDGTKLGPATAHPLKSCLALPWPAELPSGPQTLRGYARCGTSVVERVEWSLDDGAWHEAVIEDIPGEWTWYPFSFELDLAPGRHQIRTRAWDANGATQPTHKDFHPNTILWNAVTRHPVVAGD